MSLSSPGLCSPDSSPRSSLTYETSNPELREIEPRASTSNETLMTEGSGETGTSNETLATKRSDMATKAAEELVDIADGEEEKDELTPRKVVRIEVRHEIPRIWKLEKPLPQIPFEIAPGMLAV